MRQYNGVQQDTRRLSAISPAHRLSDAGPPQGARLVAVFLTFVSASPVAYDGGDGRA